MVQVNGSIRIDKYFRYQRFTFVVRMLRNTTTVHVTSTETLTLIVNIRIGTYCRRTFNMKLNMAVCLRYYSKRNAEWKAEGKIKRTRNKNMCTICQVSAFQIMSSRWSFKLQGKWLNEIIAVLYWHEPLSPGRVYRRRKLVYYWRTLRLN